MGIQEVLGRHREQILQIAEQFGATNVRVFGSVARGEADRASDIDLLVDFRPGRSLMDHAGLVVQLEQLLGRRVEVASSRGLRERIRARVLGEAVAL